MKVIAALSAVTLLLTSMGAMSASFDCESARTTIEVVVCGDQTLSVADDEMFRRYEELRLARPDVEQDQTSWVRDIRDACENSECLSRVYLDRIDWLDAQLNHLRQARTDAPSSYEAADSHNGGCPESLSRTAKLICSDSTLAAGEAEMKRQYQALVGLHPELQDLQKEWEITVRDQCSDINCMSSAFLTRITELERYEKEARRSSTADAERLPEQSEALTEAPSQLKNKVGDGAGFLALGIILAPLIVLILGSSRTVVICYDWPDYLWTLGPIVMPVVGWMWLGSLGPVEAFPTTDGQKLVLVGVAAATTHSLIKVFYNACFYNRSILVGVFVGCIKVILGPFLFLVVLGFLATSLLGLDDSGRNKHRPGHDRGNLIVILIAFLFLGWVYKSIINGSAVYQKRGWLLQPT